MRVKDQLGRELEISTRPERIVSLVPSQTELLVDLGVGSRLVGVTKFCVHPAHIRSTAAVVGGTKTIHLDKIEQLKPDLIIANKEENTWEMVDQLQQIAPVWVSDVVTVEDQLALVKQIGEIVNAEAAAHGLNQKTEQALLELKSKIMGRPKEQVVYLIWKKPYMAAGKDTFINSMIGLCGWENWVKEDRYPTLDIEQFEEVDRILLSTEPYPFKARDVDELAKATGCQVQLVDGEFFSWYGSRFPKSLGYLAKLR